VFSVQGTGGSPTGPEPEIIKTLEAQVGKFLLGYKCPVSPGIVVQEQDPLGDLLHVQMFMNVGPNPLT
jgi:hypothetical protein